MADALGVYRLDETDSGAPQAGFSGAEHGTAWSLACNDISRRAFGACQFPSALPERHLQAVSGSDDAETC